MLWILVRQKRKRMSISDDLHWWRIQDFPDRGVSLLFGKISPQNCMKIKQIGPRGGGRIPDTPLSPQTYTRRDCVNQNLSLLFSMGLNFICCWWWIQDFPEGSPITPEEKGCVNISFGKMFTQKLHENERNWTARWHFLNISSTLDPQMVVVIWNHQYDFLVTVCMYTHIKLKLTWIHLFWGITGVRLPWILPRKPTQVRPHSLHLVKMQVLREH